MVQLPLAGIVPPLNVTVVAVLVTVPPHCGEAGAAETVTPAGMVSVKLTPVSGVSLRLYRVMVTVLVPPRGMAVGEYDFVPYKAARTARLAVAGR
ncbi:MAG: hypothetical protein PGMFKBFP_02301 [Anaerolineales bacterium]|nr:hypothetical protein [Anaerolineales bacterium]